MPVELSLITTKSFNNDNVKVNVYCYCEIYLTTIENHESSYICFILSSDDDAMIILNIL